MERPYYTLKEVNNKNSPTVMLVKIPGLDKVPVNLRDDITRLKKKQTKRMKQSKKWQEKMLVEFLRTYEGCSKIW